LASSDSAEEEGVMWNLPLALVFLAVSPLFAASRPVTVNQLEEALVASHGKSDTRLARQLSGLMLTERLSAARLARWQEKMPGPESRRALVVLADLSSFLSLPPAEIPAVSPPDLPAQRELMASVVTYAAGALASAPGQPGSSPDQPVYSNHRAGDAGGPAASAEKEDCITIILIDANNLVFADLAYVRGQVVRFLDRLSARERVGVYVQNARGFQVLVEETANHAAVADRMRAWMPTAQQMARAQEEEARNRQQFDEVVHLDDLAYVNGNQNLNGQPEVMVDPQLRDFGSDPSRDAMLSLVSVARHLAPVPGHKNLAWIASDNVLADWADKAVGIEKGGKHDDAFIRRAQEVLNDAHVSVYPLDASQLETTTTDPSLANSAVEVSPSVPVPPGALPQGGAAGPGLGRQAAGMQQDLHLIQAAIQELATATGGRVFRRGGDIAGHLNSVVDEGSATYLHGFTPSMPADDKYHSLTVKLATRRNVLLRYRSGYQYSKEPATMNDRFRQAVWQPDDLHEIALSARPLPAYSGTAFRLEIAARDLELNRQGDRWIDKLDIFVVRRSPDGFVARITGRTLALALPQATYENLKDKGIPFDQFVERHNDTASLRILVADQNSGRMGSITIPASALNPATPGSQ
jgi:VWFA-related protein